MTQRSSQLCKVQTSTPGQKIDETPQVVKMLFMVGNLDEATFNPVMLWLRITAYCGVIMILENLHFHFNQILQLLIGILVLYHPERRN